MGEMPVAPPAGGNVSRMRLVYYATHALKFVKRPLI